MLDLINKSISRIFGSKQERDLKELNPYVARINAEYDQLKKLSHDQLRAKTPEFKRKITDYLSEIDGQIEKLQIEVEADPDMDLNKKESLYTEVDKLKKQRNEKTEEVLIEILPEAFAVVKETAFRFKNNTQLKVTATELDRNLAAHKQT